MLSAHLKRILRLDRLRRREAKDEFLLAAPVKNLRKIGEVHPLPSGNLRRMSEEVRICLAENGR